MVLHLHRTVSASERISAREPIVRFPYNHCVSRLKRYIGKRTYRLRLRFARDIELDGKQTGYEMGIRQGIGIMAEPMPTSPRDGLASAMTLSGMRNRLSTYDPETEPIGVLRALLDASRAAGVAGTIYEVTRESTGGKRTLAIVAVLGYWMLGRMDVVYRYVGEAKPCSSASEFLNSTLPKS